MECAAADYMEIKMTDQATELLGGTKVIKWDDVEWPKTDNDG